MSRQKNILQTLCLFYFLLSKNNILGATPSPNVSNNHQGKIIAVMLYPGRQKDLKKWLSKLTGKKSSTISLKEHTWQNVTYKQYTSANHYHYCIIPILPPQQHQPVGSSPSHDPHRLVPERHKDLLAALFDEYGKIDRFVLLLGKVTRDMLNSNSLISYSERLTDCCTRSDDTFNMELKTLTYCFFYRGDDVNASVIVDLLSFYHRMPNPKVKNFYKKFLFKESSWWSHFKWALNTSFLVRYSKLKHEKELFDHDNNKCIKRCDINLAKAAKPYRPSNRSSSNQRP